MSYNYAVIEARNLAHIRPTANDNVPHRKRMQIAIKSFKSFERPVGMNPKPQPSYETNYETNWKKSKLRLQWLND